MGGIEVSRTAAQDFAVKFAGYGQLPLAMGRHGLLELGKESGGQLGHNRLSNSSALQAAVAC
jgi:hypothetical protein